jgi:lysophospholipase L1-like esterase
VIGAQLPRLPAHADLVTCGIGVNDILYTKPSKLFADLRALIAVSAHFRPPWTGKFASDCFHPSQVGYRDWSRALLAAVASTPARSA